jgi:hypothetical protein
LLLRNDYPVDAAEDSPRRECIEAVAEVKTGLPTVYMMSRPQRKLEDRYRPNSQRQYMVASPVCASWNQMTGWLRVVDSLRRAA